MLMTALTMLAADGARADIGFVAAAATCRVAVPGQKLLALRQRTRNGVWVYEGDFTSAPPTHFTTATINRDTGALIDQASAPIPAAEFAATQQTIQRLNYAGIDFAEALPAANASATRIDTERMVLLYEAGILAFRVTYFGAATIVNIDSITGAVIPVPVPGFGVETTVSVAEMAGAVAHAQWMAGAEWIAIEANAFQRIDGVTVQVLLANRTTGRLMRPEVILGFYLSTAEFLAQGSQVSRAAAVAIPSPVRTGCIATLGVVQTVSPELGVNRIALEVAIVGGVTSYTWVTGFVDAAEVERDARTNAALSPQKTIPIIVAPVHIGPADLNADGGVDGRDLAELLAAWGSFNPMLDLDANGSVGGGDLAITLSSWGPGPG